MSSLKWNRPSASAGGEICSLKSNPTGVGASVDEQARLRVSEGGTHLSAGPGTSDTAPRSEGRTGGAAWSFRFGVKEREPDESGKVSELSLSLARSLHSV